MFVNQPKDTVQGYPDNDNNGHKETIKRVHVHVYNIHVHVYTLTGTSDTALPVIKEVMIIIHYARILSFLTKFYSILGKKYRSVH